MPTEWYVSIDSKRRGPLTSSDLRKLAASGQLARDDLVWKEGFTDWKSATKLKGLFSGPPPIPSQSKEPAHTQSPNDYGEDVHPKGQQISDNAIKQMYGCLGCLGLMIFVATAQSCACNALLNSSGPRRSNSEILRENNKSALDDWQREESRQLNRLRDSGFDVKHMPR